MITDLPDRKKILIIDDEISICKSYERMLNMAGYSVHSTQEYKKALDALKSMKFDLIITDLKLPDIDGINLILLFKKIDAEIPIIMITAYSSVDIAVHALKIGASDFLEKPVHSEELIFRIEKALETRKIIRENRILKNELIGENVYFDMIGKSRKIKDIFKSIEKIAATDASVLIRGESGTGKELIARAVYKASSRNNLPFISLDCGAIVENLFESELFGHEKGSFTGAIKNKQGLFEAADKGTLFIDEIGNISPDVQAKLLRALQERKIKPVGANEYKDIDVRIIAATNKNLEQMIADNTFREDLYYRLNVIPIFVPPLRERKEDIFLLARHFMNIYCIKNNKDTKGFSADCLSSIENYNWPGNIRELQNVMERLSITVDSQIVKTDDLPPEIKCLVIKTPEIAEIPKTNEKLKEYKKKIRENAMLELEKSFVLAALRRNNWVVSDAAKDVNMRRENFHALMNKCEIITNRKYEY